MWLEIHSTIKLKSLEDKDGVYWPSQEPGWAHIMYCFQQMTSLSGKVLFVKVGRKGKNERGRSIEKTIWSRDVGAPARRATWCVFLSLTSPLCHTPAPAPLHCSLPPAASEYSPTGWLLGEKKKKTKLKCPFLHHLYFPRCLWKTPMFWRTRVMNSQCTFTNPLASSWEERVPKPVCHAHRDHSEAPCPLPSPWAELSKFAKYLPSAVFMSVTCSLRKRNISFISVFLVPRTQVLTIAL